MRQIAFWTFIGVLDILTDIGIMVVPIVVVYDLAVPRSKKYVIMSAFGFRILFGPQLRLLRSQSDRSAVPSLQRFAVLSTSYLLYAPQITRRKLLGFN